MFCRLYNCTRTVPTSTSPWLHFSISLIKYDNIHVSVCHICSTFKCIQYSCIGQVYFKVFMSHTHKNYIKTVFLFTGGVADLHPGFYDLFMHLLLCPMSPVVWKTLHWREPVQGSHRLHYTHSSLGPGPVQAHKIWEGGRCCDEAPSNCGKKRKTKQINIYNVVLLLLSYMALSVSDNSYDIKDKTTIQPSECIWAWLCARGWCCSSWLRRISGSAGLLCFFSLLLQAQPEGFTLGCQVCSFRLYTVQLLAQQTMNPRRKKKRIMGGRWGRSTSIKQKGTQVDKNHNHKWSGKARV